MKKQDKKSVCVLLSTYNGEKYLRELLDSVFAQEDVEVKLFVRDDGSSDSTVSILKEYEEKNLVTLTVGNNLGFVKSFSWLIKNAPEADYYACCDQDDVWLPKKLINGVTCMEEHGQEIPQLYFTSLVVVDKNLKEITRKSHTHYAINAKNRFVENLLFNMVQGCSTIFNSALRDVYKSIPTDDLTSHDYTLSTLASGLGIVHFSEDAQVLYRQHGNNSVGFYASGIKSFFRSIKSFFKLEMKSVRYREALIFKYYFYDKLSDENKRFVDLMSKYKFYKKTKKELKKFIKQNVTDKFVRNYSLNLARMNKL